MLLLAEVNLQGLHSATSCVERFGFPDGFAFVQLFWEIDLDLSEVNQGLRFSVCVDFDFARP
jgi:hypothetical protein